MSSDMTNNTDVITFPSVVRLNVGGLHFTTRLSSLQKYEDSMLAAMFSGRHNTDKDQDGRYFIDRDGKYFIHILNYLRDEVLPPPEVAQQVYDDAHYYGLQHFMECLRTSPGMFGEIVRQTFLTQFEKYDENLEKIIRSAKERGLNSATYSRQSDIVFGVKFSKNSPEYAADHKYNENHECYTTDGRGKNYRKAEVVFGPWDAPVSRMDILVQCIITDLTKRGFQVESSNEQSSLCRYYVGRGREVVSCETRLTHLIFGWW
ncbi:BTB/POZ domain-containing protein KCTD7-like [Glandiceps talaboti]